MGFSKIANRYAKSLLQLAKEAGQMDAIGADMQLLSETISDSKDLKLLLNNPVVTAEQKFKILQSVFDGKVSNATINLMQTTIQNKRESYLKDIANAYISQQMALENKEIAEITTAVPINDELRAKALSVIKTMSDKNITLKEIVDADILGGMIVRIGDRQIDASVKRRLRTFQQELSKNVHISDRYNPN